jgi:hypothetical protein
VNTLVKQQEALLEAVLAPTWTQAAAALEGWARFPWHRGLQAYRANGQALAQRALASAYPVTRQLLGGDSFDGLASACWHDQPPTRGDMAHWGEHVPRFLQSSSQLADEPYLADLARLEWLLHTLTTAADAQPDLRTLALLTQGDATVQFLQLSPGWSQMQSAYPVVSLVHAHLSGTPTLQDAGERLKRGLAEQAVVWRQGMRPRVRTAMPGEFDFLAAIASHSSVLQALQSAPELDFAAWLALAVNTGLFISVTTAGTPPGPMGESVQHASCPHPQP